MVKAKIIKEKPKLIINGITFSEEKIKRAMCCVCGGSIDFSDLQAGKAFYCNTKRKQEWFRHKECLEW